MLAASDAVAGARQRVNHAIRVHKLHVVRLRTLDKRVPLHPVQTEVTDAVFRVIRLPTLRDRNIDPHPVQLTQRERALVRAGDILRVRLWRRLEPAHHLPARNRRAVECHKMRPGENKPPGNRGVRHGDHAFIIRQIDAKIVVDVHNASAHAFELAVHIHQIAAVQVEPVVIIGERHVPLRKVYPNHRPARQPLIRNDRSRRRCCGLFLLLLRKSKADLKLHNDLPFRFILFLLLMLSYRFVCPIKRTSVKNVKYT